MTRALTRGKQIAREQGFLFLLRKLYFIVLWGLFGRVLVYPMMRDFHRRAARATSIEDAVDLVLSYSYLGARIAPMQVKEEIVELLRMMESLKPKVVLDIGTAWGGTLFMFTRVAAPDSLLVTVDLPGRLWGASCPSWMSPMVQSFATDMQSIVQVRGDSHSSEVLDRVKKALGARGADFLFIDGDHSYDGVKMDFEMYSQLVAEHGLVAFHDICEGSEELVGEVPRFWTEVKRGLSTREIVADPMQGGCGIGLVFKDRRSSI